MISIPIKEYIHNLIKESHRYQYTNISTGRISLPKYWFGLLKWIFIGISVYFLLYTSSFKSDILNSLITAFSILVGLLVNLLMTVYTMTQKLKEEPQKTVMQKDIFKKKANFFKQFGYLTTYAILLSIVCIILSILNQCSTTEMLPIVELVKCEWSFTPQDILATSRIIFYGLIKASLVYFVLDLLYIVLFTVCSFIDYLNGEIKDIEESSEQ